jgi:hypothetical protein
MFNFLLICPTPALAKIDPRNRPSIPAVKFFFRLGFEQISYKLEDRVTLKKQHPLNKGGKNGPNNRY